MNLPEIADHEVLRAYVAVNDALGVGVCYRLAEAPEIIEKAAQRRREVGASQAVKSGDTFADRLPDDPLHGEPYATVGELAPIVEGDYARMLESRRELDLLSEPRTVLRQAPRRKLHLQRDTPPDMTIPHLTDVAEPAPTNTAYVLIAKLEILGSEFRRAGGLSTRDLDAMRGYARKLPVEELLELVERIAVDSVRVRDEVKLIEHDVCVPVLTSYGKRGMDSTGQMGLIKHLASGRTIVLAAHALVGRAPGCTVRLSDPASSSDHASISWNGDRWEVRDLGSTNGTFVDGAPVPPKERVQLSRGSVFRFGCDAERWELVDERGPVVIATTEAGELRVAEDGLLVLPNASEVLVSIVLNSQGVWVFEAADGSRRRARHAERITVAGQTWELTVPPDSPVAGTYKAKQRLSLSTLELRFHVSQNEEHVRVDVVDGETVLALRERTAFYVLLLLARERLKDAAAGKLRVEEQGWYTMEDLTRDAHVDEKPLNTMIHRVRKDFAKLGIEGAEGIVERRKGLLRIGTGRLRELVG